MIVSLSSYVNVDFIRIVDGFFYFHTLESNKCGNMIESWRQIINSPYVLKGCVFLSAITATFYYFIQVSLYSTPLFIGDTWHIIDNILSENQELGFAAQHGPHRMGMAHLLYDLAFSVGIERAEFHAWTQALIWWVSGGFGLFILRNSRGRWLFTDALIPFVFLFPGTLLSTISIPYIHGFTVFFTLAIVSAFSISRKGVRMGIVLLLLTLSSFTFNANLVAVAFGAYALLAIGGNQKFRNEYLTYLLWIVFLGVYLVVTFNLEEGVSAIKEEFSVIGWLTYILQLSTQFIFFQADKYVFGLSLGLFVLLILIWIIPAIINKSKGIHPRWIPIFVILLFWMLNAFSRWSLGVGNAHGARYLNLVPLLLFSLYWSTEFLKRFRNVAIYILGFAILFSWNRSRQIHFLLESNQREQIEMIKSLKQGEYESVATQIHKFPERVHLKVNLKKLGFLED